MSQGFAFVQFKNASEAREAMTAMNGFQLAGRVDPHPHPGR